MSAPDDSGGERTALRDSSTPPPRRQDARFTPGTVLAGRYRIIALLGKGGMGEVYRAEDLKLGQQVALKFLPLSLAQDPQKLERLYAEVRLGRQVSHPNVCRLYDAVEWEGNHFIAMEYIDGEDLASLLRRIGKLPHGKAIDIARDLCSGLAAAHATGIVHRDLKPANVMIDGRGVTRITDFGLAALTADLAASHEISGTPAYMAPEQLTGGEITARTDFYALGLIAYEMFTGKRLFEASSLGEIINQHRSPHSQSLSQQTRDIDPAVQRVILRCLEEKPENRPPSVQSIMQSLPGGDPLQAALDAGETPSPEMIAAAGEVGELRWFVAWGLLGLAVVLIFLSAALSARTKLYNRVSLPNEPQVLVHRAKEILRQLGYAPGSDSSYFLNWDEQFFVDVTRQKSRRDPNTTRPSPVVFRYRESPAELIPITLEWRVDDEDPPFDLPGMTRVGLDPAGRLLYFGAVPPRVTDTPNTPQQPVEWTKVIVDAGVDPASLRVVPSRWAARFDTDAKQAWEGRFVEGGQSIRIEAASYRGKPVWFELIPPWRKPPLEEKSSVFDKIQNVFGVVAPASILVWGAFLARRNLRRGRGDRKGALRIGAFVFFLTFVSRAFRASHSPPAQLAEEWALIVQLLSEALFWGGGTWLLYVALEPYVRRRWPRALISWSRLLSGRFRDPLVGRDILIGTIAGLALTLLVQSGIVFAEMTPIRTYLTALSDLGQVIHILAKNLQVAATGALTAGVFFVVLRLVLRKRLAVQIAAVSILCLLIPSPGENLPVEMVVRVLSAILFVVVFFRFGILSTAAIFFVSFVITEAPTTLDSSRWYFGRSLAVLVLLVGLAAWAFRLALADQPIFGKVLLEDEA